MSGAGDGEGKTRYYGDCYQAQGQKWDEERREIRKASRQEETSTKKKGENGRQEGKINPVQGKKTGKKEARRHEETSTDKVTHRLQEGANPEALGRSIGLL